MRALVTGGAGFVGRHMAAALVDRGYVVSTWDLADGADARALFRSNITTPHDLVVHCAFHVGGRAAIDREPRLLARNLELDAAMFDWAVRTEQARVLYFSSSAAYPVDLQDDPASDRRLSEGDVFWGENVVGTPDARYGWAKLTGEHLARAAAESGLPVHVVRPFSGYGADQSLDYPFPSFIDRARRGEDPMVIWGPGTQVRDWIHIDDVVAGALAVVDADYRQPVNLCTGIGTSMLDLAYMCCRAAGNNTVTLAPQPDKPTGVANRVGDPTLFHRFYTPRVSLQEGVERALAATGAITG